MKPPTGRTYRAEIYRYVNAHPGLTARQVATGVGCTYSYAAAVLDEYSLGRLLNYTPDGRRAYWWPR